MTADESRPESPLIANRSTSVPHRPVLLALLCCAGLACSAALAWGAELPNAGRPSTFLRVGHQITRHLPEGIRSRVDRMMQNVVDTRRSSKVLEREVARLFREHPEAKRELKRAVPFLSRAKGVAYCVGKWCAIGTMPLAPFLPIFSLPLNALVAGKCDIAEHRIQVACYSKILHAAVDRGLIPDNRLRSLRRHLDAAAR